MFEQLKIFLSKESLNLNFP